MSPARTRILVVDDSAFARKVLREVLTACAELEVVGTARDGLDALEKIAQLSPDVVTLDLMMPGLDGVGVMRELAAMGHPARVVLVSVSDPDSEAVAEALALGAVELVRKPTALATARLFELGEQLVEKVRAAAAARIAPARTPPAAEPPVGAAVATTTRVATPSVDLVVVGTSTGGPQALTRLLTRLPAGLPVPVAVALHIPEDYTAALARRLDREARLAVVEAADGERLEAGTVYLARGGHHLAIAREGSHLVARRALESAAAYVPSVDVLFASAARATAGRVLGVVLTGMGDDGLAGSRAIVEAGGRVLAEAESSCVVYGMPRCVIEAGFATREAPLAEMDAAILDLLESGG